MKHASLVDATQSAGAKVEPTASATPSKVQPIGIEERNDIVERANRPSHLPQLLLGDDDGRDAGEFETDEPSGGMPQ